MILFFLPQFGEYFFIVPLGYFNCSIYCTFCLYVPSIVFICCNSSAVTDCRDRFCCVVLSDVHIFDFKRPTESHLPLQRANRK